MGKITKAEAIRIITDCAEGYEKNLLDKSLLFVLHDKHKTVSFLEVSFRRFNFLHLTGIKLAKGKDPGRGHRISASKFFKKCIDHKLKESDFDLADNGTTEMKLKVLPMMMAPDLGARSVGTYNNSQPKLYTEKLAGGIKGCMGFCKISGKGEAMYPNTLLNEDIRKVTKETRRVIAVYKKDIAAERYEECVYIAKKVDWGRVQYPGKYSYIRVPCGH